MMELLNNHFWLWIGIAIFFVILEITIGTFSLIWLALAALILGGILWKVPDLSWQFQFIIFSGLSFAGLILWKKYLKHFSKSTKRSFLNQKIEQYRGKIYLLIEPISNGIGKVKIGDSVWQVTGPDLQAGKKVKVMGMNGTYLEVLPAE